MPRRRALVAVVASCILLAAAAGARAACNLIPSASQTFRGTLGSTDRPFAGPGEFVELRIRPQVCDGASLGFLSTNPDQYAVTIVFTPPGAGPRNVVVVATDCTGIGTCGGAASTTCDPAGATGLAIVTRDGEQRLQFRFPDTDALLGTASDGRTLTGPVTIAVTPRAAALPCALVTSPCSAVSSLTACIDDLYRLDGSCRATVDPTFGHFTALPPPNRYEEVCTSPAFPNGPCTGAATEVRFTVDAAGNALLPVDWQGILVQASNVPVPRLLRGGTSIDALSASTGPIRIPGQAFSTSFTPEGAVLPPIFLPQVDPMAANELTIFGSADAPHTVLRVARKSPTNQECNGGTFDDRPCTQASECPDGTCQQATCRGGPAVGQQCDEDADCPTSQCGPALFEFRDRLVSGVGPVVVPRTVLTGGGGVCEDGGDAGLSCTIPGPACADSSPCVDYRVVAQNPVPLEGLAGTDDVFAFSVSEKIAVRQLNDDGDTADLVLVLTDRETGETLPIGNGMAEGRAIAAVRQPPFAFPALATEGQLVAFLEPEALEGEPIARNKNGDSDAFDTILRVFRAETNGSVTHVDGGLATPRAVDAALLVNERSLALSEGFVFFRTPEASGAPLTTTRVSVGPGGSEGTGYSNWPTVSADGSIVAFSSTAGDLVVPNDTNDVCDVEGRGEAPGVLPCFDIFVRDRTASTTERVSVTSGGTPGDRWSFAQSISADGNTLVFASHSNNLSGGSGHHVIVRDRQAPSTSTASVSTGGTLASDASTGYPGISATGRYVGFTSRALNLDGPSGDPNPSGPYYNDPNGFPGLDAYVRDRIQPFTEAVSLAYDPTPPSDTLSNGTVGVMGFNVNGVSTDGRWAVFVAESTNLIDTSPGPGQFVFLRDRATDTTRLISRNTAGAVASCFFPQMSDDGRFITFHCQASLVPGDLNTQCDVSGVGNGASACIDVYLYDRDLDRVERVSVASDGGEGNGASAFGSLSRDGRYVTFWSEATNFDPDDMNGYADIFLRDRLTGLTTRVNVADDGSEADDDSGWPSGTATGAGGLQVATVSTDARTVAFTSFATNLVDNDLNTASDVFVRVADPMATTHDLSGDGDLDDTLLQVLNANGAPPSSPITLCPAGAVAVASGRAAFLRPEAAGTATGCPNTPLVGPLPDLNNDGDTADEVVHLWNGTSIDNLGLAATAVALSDTHVAAIGGTVRVRPVASGSFVDTAQAADTIAFCGSVVAFLTPESLQAANLNGDADQLDRVLQLWDTATGTLVNVGQAAEEFVCTADQIAFRTRESVQCGGPSCPTGLNGPTDTDTLDDVLQVYDLARAECLTPSAPADCRANSGQAVRPCRLEACDPRLPYRVGTDSVKFLTFECDQGGSVTAGCPAGGTDLNGETPPDAHDLIIQVFNVRTRTTTPIGTVLPDAETQPNPLQGEETTESGTNGGDNGTVFVSSGRCIETLSAGCTTNAQCDNGGFCEALTCKRDQGVCVTDDDCPGDAICRSDPIVPASPDDDVDGVPDHLDSCPTVANADQADADGDEVGDACDLLCNSRVADTRARVVVRSASGTVSARMVIDLAGYTDAPVSAVLSDPNSPSLATADLGTIAPVGNSGRKWLYTSTADGVKRLVLRDLAPRQPGKFKIAFKARHWYSAAEADASLADTEFALQIGSACFGRTATKKVD